LDRPISVRVSFILVALAASWPATARAQSAPSRDASVVPFRWDSRGRHLALDGPNLRAGAVAFGPDGSTLFVGYDDGSIRRHDAGSGWQAGRKVEPGSAAIHALAVSADGRGLAVAVPGPLNFVVSGDIVTLRRPDGAAVGELSRMPGQVIALAYAADGKTIGAIDHLSNVRVWRVEDRSEVLSSEILRANGVRRVSAEVRASFSADLKRAVIVNSADDVIYKDVPWNHLVGLWEAGVKESRIVGHRTGMEISSAIVSPDGSRFVTAQELHYVFFNDFVSGNSLNGYSPGSVRGDIRLTFLMLSPDNRRLVSATKRGAVYVNNLDDKLNGLRGFGGPNGYVRAAAFVPKGVRFASGGWDPLGAETIPGTDQPKYEPVILWEVEVEEK